MATSSIRANSTKLKRMPIGQDTYMDVGGRAKHDSREGGGRAKQDARAEDARAERLVRIAQYLRTPKKITPNGI